MHHVCHAVDRMCDTRVRFKCAKAARLCAARGLHVRFGTYPFPVSGHVRRRLEKKLRHSASVRLTCMLSITDYQCQYQGTKKKAQRKKSGDKVVEKAGKKESAQA